MLTHCEQLYFKSTRDGVPKKHYSSVICYVIATAAYPDFPAAGVRQPASKGSVSAGHLWGLPGCPTGPGAKRQGIQYHRTNEDRGQTHHVSPQ